MENFAWEWEVLQLLTAHVEHRAPLPRTLFDKMIRGEELSKRLWMARQLEFALFDMLVHHELDPFQRRRRGRRAPDRRGATRGCRGSGNPITCDRACLHPHLLGWLRGRLLQLQMGGGVVR